VRRGELRREITREVAAAGEEQEGRGHVVARGQGVSVPALSSGNSCGNNTPFETKTFGSGFSYVKADPAWLLEQDLAALGRGTLQEKALERLGEVSREIPDRLVAF
jgi:hypothetical protein